MFHFCHVFIYSFIYLVILYRIIPQLAAVKYNQCIACQHFSGFPPICVFSFEPTHVSLISIQLSLHFLSFCILCNKILIIFSLICFFLSFYFSSLFNHTANFYYKHAAIHIFSYFNHYVLSIYLSFIWITYLVITILVSCRHSSI